MPWSWALFSLYRLTSGRFPAAAVYAISCLTSIVCSACFASMKVLKLFPINLLALSTSFPSSTQLYISRSLKSM